MKREVVTWGPRRTGEKPHRPHSRDVVQDLFGAVYAGFRSARHIGSIYQLANIVKARNGDSLMDRTLHARVLRAVEECCVREAMKGRSCPGYRIARNLLWYEIHVD